MMKSFWQEFKIIILLFIFFCGIIFFIIDGGTTLVIAKYNCLQTINWMRYEITRPPFFLNIPKLAWVNSSKSPSKDDKYFVSAPLKHQVSAIPPEASKENLLVIPKFKIKAPIKIVSQPNLRLIYRELRKGVVLYPGSAIPGKGYSIIIGHSSQYPWRPGKYKRVFSLLTELRKGDEIYVYWQQKPLIFQVEDKKIFLPWPKGTDMTETIFPPDNRPVLILQSCWPVGVAYKRIAVKTVLIK